MKKDYQKKVAPETAEPMTAALDVVSNIFRNIAAEDEDEITSVNL